MSRPAGMRIDITDGRMARSGPDWSTGSDEVPIRAAVEALLMVSEQPVTVEDLRAFLGQDPERIEMILDELAAGYEKEGRGFELRKVDGGWRYYTARHVAAIVAAKAADRQGSRLSGAALETLAVIAYRQPISRSRIAAIRGVNVDGVVRTLMCRGLVDEMASDPETGAALLGTTGYFLERMGLSSIADLPDLAEHLPDFGMLDDFSDPMQ